MAKEMKKLFLSEMYTYMFLNERALFNILLGFYLPHTLFLTSIDDGKTNKLRVCNLRGDFSFDIPFPLPADREYYIEQKGHMLYYSRNQRRNIAINLATHQSKMVDEKHGAYPIQPDDPKIGVEYTGGEFIRIKNKENGLVRKYSKYGFCEIACCKDLVGLAGIGRTFFLNKDTLKAVAHLEGRWNCGAEYPAHHDGLVTNFGSDIFVIEKGVTETPENVKDSLCLDHDGDSKTIVAEISKDGDKELYLHNSVIFGISLE